jgi:hypothetical protein
MIVTVRVGGVERARGDWRVIEEWKLRVAGMSMGECKAMIKRMREKEASGVKWNGNTLKVYGLLKERMQLLMDQQGVRLRKVYEEGKREDDERAERKILEECGKREELLTAEERKWRSPGWEEDLKRRREWGQRQKAKREARRHW